MKTLARIPWTLRAAFAIWLAAAFLHLIGARDWVSVLSGTPVPGIPYEAAILVGALYVLTWLAAVVVVPILAIAAALDALARRVAGRDERAAKKGLAS